MFWCFFKLSCQFCYYDFFLDLFYVHKVIVINIGTMNHQNKVRQTQPINHGVSEMFYIILIEDILFVHDNNHNTLYCICDVFRSIFGI